MVLLSYQQRDQGGLLRQQYYKTLDYFFLTEKWHIFHHP